jgi:hypothetical protein
MSVALSRAVIMRTVLPPASHQVRACPAHTVKLCFSTGRMWLVRLFGSASDSYNTQPVKTTKRTRGESREVGGGALRLRQAPGRRGSRKAAALAGDGQNCTPRRAGRFGDVVESAKKHDADAGWAR